MIEIEVSNQQTSHPVAERRLVSAARRILRDEGIRSGSVSIAVVDDPTIHKLNCRYLQHDYATDVLSFLLERRDDFLEGEVIISAETAAASCGRFGWSRDEEMLLYVVHGMLHLLGYDDQSPQDQGVMRDRERHYLESFGVDVRYEEVKHEPQASASDDGPRAEEEGLR
jgi:probable rRNA maturation factor